jgi:hypothetical protein
MLPSPISVQPPVHRLPLTKPKRQSTLDYRPHAPLPPLAALKAVRREECRSETGIPSHARAAARPMKVRTLSTAFESMSGEAERVERWGFGTLENPSIVLRAAQAPFRAMYPLRRCHWTQLLASGRSW